MNKDRIINFSVKFSENGKLMSYNFQNKKASIVHSPTNGYGCQMLVRHTL